MRVRLYVSKKSTAGNHEHLVADYPNGFVAELEIPPYRIPPSGIQWGQRFFTYVGKTEEYLVFREDIMWVVGV